MIQLIQQAALFAGTLAGAATDAKTGYIYDWITYPMIAVGVITSLVAWQTTNLILGLAMFILLFVGYRLGKIGGGDVKIFTGIALLNPYNDISFLLTAALFAAALSMLFYSVFYSIKYARKGIKWEENMEGMLKAGILGLALALYFAAMSAYGMMNSFMLYALGVPFAFGLGFVALQKGIKRNFFEKRIAVGKLEEDEIIAAGRNTSKVMAALKGKQLIGKREAALLKRRGIRFVFVLRDLPKFGPFIFFGVLLALMQPNFFALLIA